MLFIQLIFKIASKILCWFDYFIHSTKWISYKNLTFRSAGKIHLRRHIWLTDTSIFTESSEIVLVMPYSDLLLFLRVHLLKDSWQISPQSEAWIFDIYAAGQHVPLSSIVPDIWWLGPANGSESNLFNLENCR
jgi:hypothetical protein